MKKSPEHIGWGFAIVADLIGLVLAIPFSDLGFWPWVFIGQLFGLIVLYVFFGALQGWNPTKWGDQ